MPTDFGTPSAHDQPAWQRPMTYRIRTVSEITGIPRNTLIAWERRYGVIHPERHPNGYRSYSEEDVSQLLRIKNAQKAGLKISEAFSLLKRGDTSAGPPSAAAQLSPMPQLASEGLSSLKDQLVQALIGYRKEEAERLLGRLVTIPFPTRVLEVYFPVLTEIGNRWEKGEVSVAQEHYASSIIRGHLASILLNIGPASSKAPHAACTTFPGEQHEMAALALSIQLSLAGFRVSYLGPNLPTEDLVGFVSSQKPTLTCVSVINPINPQELEIYAQRVSAALPEDGRLIIGGKTLEGVELPHVPRVRLQTEWWTGVSL